MVTAGCLVASASVGSWVTDRSRSWLREEAEWGFRKELREVGIHRELEVSEEKGSLHVDFSKAKS